MKVSAFRRIIFILIAALTLSCAFPAQEAYGRRRSKAKTTATSRSKKSKKSKKRRSSRKSTSGKSRTRRSYSQLPFRGQAVSSRVPEGEREPLTLTRASGSPTARTLASAGNKRRIKVEKPDLDKIREQTLNPKSQYYFPKLLEKYQRNDTIMTADEYRNFYLGYMFQEDYDPYRTSPYSGVTDPLREKATHTKEEIDTIRKYAELSLKDNPFDLRQMSFLVHVLKEKEKNMSAKIWEYRLENLLGAIKSTGTGEDTENAWYVIYPMHEYDMVQLMGYEATDAKFIDPGYDYLVVEPDDETRKRLKDKVAKGFYFNVLLPGEQYELKHPEEMAAVTEDEVEIAPDDAAAEKSAEDEEEEESGEADEIPAE